MPNITYEINETIEKEFWLLKDVKHYLRVSHDNDDQLIENLIKAAVECAKQFIGIDFSVKTITCKIDSAPPRIKLKFGPILYLEKAYLTDSKKDITEEVGYIDPGRECILIEPEFHYQALELTYEMGLGGVVPHSIIQGVLMHIGNMYDMENVTNISLEIKNMYLPYRKLKI